MIDWWIIPAVLTALVAFLLERVASSDSVDYAGFAAIGLAVLCVPILVVIWLLCFILKVFA